MTTRRPRYALSSIAVGLLTILLCASVAWGQEGDLSTKTPAASDGAAGAADDGDAVDGKLEIAEIKGSGGVPVREERLTVTVPEGDKGLVRYQFTNRGGTLRSAKMLHERFTRDKDLAPWNNVPAEKLEAGPIELITTWDASFLPYRAVFRELTYQGQIVRVRRRTEVARVTEGRLEAPREGDVMAVDRPIRPQDSLTISAPEALKGTYTITKVHPSGAASVEPKLPEGNHENVTLEISRKGDFAELFKAEPTFVRIGAGGTDGAEGLPVRYVWPDPRTDTSDVFIEKRWTTGTHAYELGLSIILHNVGKYDLKEGLGVQVVGWQHPADSDGSAFLPPTTLYAGSCYTDDSWSGTRSRSWPKRPPKRSNPCRSPRRPAGSASTPPTS